LPNTNPFVNTKLRAPPARGEMVMRPRLTRLLERGLEGTLTLLCAPAGFGKTTLLVEWLLGEAAGGPGARRVAWLALDGDDNDPARFVGCLAAALERVRPGVERAAQLMTNSPRPLSSAPRTVLALLINTLEVPDENTAAAAPAVLVLDDYHVISNPAIHDAMAFLLDHLPASLRVVMATRANPPLPLARLRARGQLTEIRAGELRFTSPETDQLLNGLLGLGLAPADVSAVDERTEGWAAGLHLAAMALRGPARPADRGALVSALAGSQRFILDFLAEEVINRQPVHVREFLLRTCLLRQLCAPLCEAVTAESNLARPHIDSQAMLDHLERHNLFLAPLDNERRWYRYHSLFAEALKSLAQPTAEAAAETHRRAAGWFAAHGVMTEAVWHALAAPDPDGAARLIDASYHQLIQRGELVTLENWLNALPPGWVDSRARLSLAAAWAGAYSASQAEFERHLMMAEAAIPSVPEAEQGLVQGELAVLSGVYASTHWQADAALRLTRKALALLPESKRWLRSIAYQALGNAHRLRGEVALAEQAYREVIAYSRAEGAPLFGLIAAGRLGQVQIQQGQLRAAAETLRKVEQQARATAGALPMFAGDALVHLAEVLFEWDELELAKSTLLRGLDWAAQGHNAGAIFAARLLQARLEAAQGNQGAARAALRQASEVATQHGFTDPAIDELGVVTAQVDLAAGEVAAAGDWAALQASRDQSQYERDEVELTLARVRLAQGRPTDAQRHIAAARRSAAGQGRQGTLIACLALTAVALHGQRETPKALTALAQALAQAEPEGYVRLFAEAGPAMADLLARVRGPQQAYAERLRAGGGQTAGRPAQTAHLSGSPVALVEPLSARELEVLGWLAGGASNRVIAEALVISVGTVKTHISRIMGKLDARNRTEAVARARQVGLLE
jgi:LuxR family maltose regulon positive regulatory protein